MEGGYKNRYDVTILVNGLPLVQMELKRRGLFHFVQLFVISNGVNTKYFANAPPLSFKQTFFTGRRRTTKRSATKDLSRQKLHSHVITDAIKDEQAACV